MASGCFGLMYNYRPLEMWLNNHPAFGKGPHIEGDPLYTEMKAFEAFGIDPDIGWRKPIDTRKAIVGEYVARTAMDAMIAYDTRPKERGKS